jgi:hypothetical protein
MRRYMNDPTQVNALRSLLRSKGYNVAGGGPMSPRLMNAYKHYQANQHQPHYGAHTWNRSPIGQTGMGEHAITDAHGRVVGHSNTAGHGGGMDVVADAGGGGGTGSRRYGRQRPVVQPVGHGHKPHGGGGGGGGGGAGGGGGGMGAADPSMFPGVPGVDEGDPNTAHLLGRGMADTLAGMQFDPQIQELMTQIEQGKRDESQNQADIGHWYGQVEGAQHTAGQRDTEANQAAKDSVNNALQGILASLGGSRGAGVVGAAGLNDLTDLAAQGSSQDRYNADLAPLLKDEAAGQHSREAAAASQIASQRGNALVGLRGQRGQAKAKALMDIVQANNQGRQSNFQNRLAIQNARLAAASLGLNADQTYAGIAAQQANTRMNQQKLKLESLAAQQKTGKMSWAKLNYPDRQTVIQDAVQRAVATLKGGHGNWDPQAVYASALANLRAGGFRAAQPWGRKGKFSKQSRQQIHNALDQAIAAAQQQWTTKYPQ